MSESDRLNGCTDRIELVFVKREWTFSEIVETCIQLYG